MRYGCDRDHGIEKIGECCQCESVANSNVANSNFFGGGRGVVSPTCFYMFNMVNHKKNRQFHVLGEESR